MTRSPLTETWRPVTALPTLFGSQTHKLADDVFHRHTADDGGSCRNCGRSSPCPARQRAAVVLVAAGDHQPAALPASTPRRVGHNSPDMRTTGQATPDGRYGYPLGGRGRTVNPRGYIYEREPEV